MVPDNNFSVLDMAAAYAEDDGGDESDLFAQPIHTTPAEEAPIEASPVTETPKKKKPWTPDAGLLDEMPELQARPVTFSKEELEQEENNGFMKNIADDEATDLARKSMDVMERAAMNIEDAKRRNGIKYLQIPPEAGDRPGQYHASLMAAAEDDDYKRGQQNIDKLLEDIKQTHPEYIIYEDKTPTTPSGTDFRNTGDDIIELPSDAQIVTDETEEVPASQENDSEKEVKIIIDKRQVTDVSFTPEELEKIRKSRTIELNIVEGDTIEFGEIEEVEGGVVDQILEQYHAKVNSIEAALPASKYRCTFVGLSYPEVMDLSNSNRVNNLDGEWLMWSIIFNHLKNPSIGPFEEWDWYIDPKTNKRVEVHHPAKVPNNIPRDSVFHVSKFHDFLMKTSYKDQQFMIWKILCATAMDKEIINVVCRSKINGTECGHSYDWIYSPSELIQMDQINEAVLDDMKKTAESMGSQIMTQYKTSPLIANNTVTLKSSGFRMVYGHVSAYDYLTDIYEKINVDEEDMKSDPGMASTTLNANMLPAIKAILIPMGDGKFSKVSKPDDILKILKTLDEVDWQSLATVAGMIIDPYEITFALDVQCPKCHSKALIPIQDLSRLLFIIARSLTSVQVELKQI